MELLGYIPVISSVVENIENQLNANITDDTEKIRIKINENRIAVEGKETITPNKYYVVFSFRCLIYSKVPDGDAEVLTTNQYADNYVFVSQGISITCNENLDITAHDAFKALDYNSGDTVIIPANSLAGVSIVNILENSGDDFSLTNKIKEQALAELDKIQLPTLDWENMFKRQGGNYADIYLDPTFSKLTNGTIQDEIVVTTNNLGTTETKKKVWKGDYPLDRYVYVIQSNLDLLYSNKMINEATYASLYSNLFAGAMQQATILEQARIQAYEQASQFQIKTLVEYYLGIITAKLNTLKSLSEYDIMLLQKALVKMQTKLYNIQCNGFKANSINKVFTAQLDGATTAFSAGLTETPPAIYNNAELMTLYTKVGSDNLMGI